MIADIGAFHFPPFAFFQGIDQGLHTLAEVRKYFLEVDQMKAKGSTLLGMDFEKEPIGISFGIDIILKDESKSTGLLLLVFDEHVHQVSALES